MFRHTGCQRAIPWALERMLSFTIWMLAPSTVGHASTCRHDLLAAVRPATAANITVTVRPEFLNAGDTGTFVHSRERTLEDILLTGRVGFRSRAFRLFRPARLRGQRVLDLGCGGGRVVDQLSAKGIDAEGVDLLLEGPQAGQSNYHCADVRETGLPPARHDRIISSFSIFYYPCSTASLARALTEIKRLLRPRGYVLIVGMHYGTTKIFEDLAKTAGLAVVETTGNRVYLLRHAGDQ